MGHVGFWAIGRSEMFSQGDDKFDLAHPLKSLGILLLMVPLPSGGGYNKCGQQELQALYTAKPRQL